MEWSVDIARGMMIKSLNNILPPINMHHVNFPITRLSEPRVRDNASENLSLV